ncbi:MAG TPA: HAMP domain-containing sensor histidine kinase [Gammaproteobacteria bacterium]|nr:HAMP domain-containing sensor histidine kinase [Gammaproteobacteria bacterium]
MNFFKKIFISLVVIAFLSSLSIVVVIYSVFKKDIEKEFFDRYKSDAAIISNTFRQLELASDIKNRIAVLMLSEIEKKNGIPPDDALDALAKKLNINGFYVIDKTGRFLRSSDISIKLQHNSLFSYDPGYKNLIYGNLDFATTPIIPSYPYDIPAKLMMIPNHNKTLILEAGIHLEYIEKILQQVVSADKNIKSIGLYAPTGYELGSIASDGTFHQGRRNFNKKMFLNNVIVDNRLLISEKVSPDYQHCLECKNKKVSVDGKYYYILSLEVSVSPLINKINILRYQICAIFIIILILSIAFSAWVSKKLVIRIKKINAAVNDIARHKNLSSRVNVNGSDEIAKLANSFNNMVEALKTNQANLIESEKKSASSDLATRAARVAHDISSPIAAMEISLQLIDERHFEKEFFIVRSAIQRMRGIADNLLNQYRNQPQFSPILLKTLLEDVVLLKQREWLNKDCELILTFDSVSETDQIIGDPVEINRMLSNLLNNAIEASVLPAKIMMNVRNEITFFQIDISDNGSGIPAEKMDECLNGKSSKHAGQGLGLSSAKKYMKSIGGELLLTSQQGKGTTVTLKFRLTT